MTLPRVELGLPYVTRDFPGIGGKIKQRPDHFIVEEIPLYEPEGKGEHLFVNITKENKTTREIQLELAELFKLKPHNIGRAGLKDKDARTTQTFSILLQNYNKPTRELKELIEKNIEVTVNWMKYHGNKLRTGHLLGNKFIITITELEVKKEEAYKVSRMISDQLHESGLPNFYGEQRTGKEGENIVLGWKILRGEEWIKNKWLRRYLISSYQSYLCNRYLAMRFRKGLFLKMLPGDLAKKHDTGGLFWVDDPVNAQRRFNNREISYTAPMYGYKMTEAKNEAKKLEDEVIEAAGISNDQFRKHKITGTRRLGRILPDITTEKSKKGIVLKFELPKGSFATIVLREFMKN